MQTRYDAKNPAALARLRQQDIAIEPFPDTIMAAARDASAQLLSDLAAGDATFKKVLEAWQSFLVDAVAREGRTG
jgi:TRAP-type mannitol/chloroaromatic compound transport system substrate-binding protein